MLKRKTGTLIRSAPNDQRNKVMKMFPACTLPIRDDTSGKITKQWITKVEEWANLCMEQGISEEEVNNFFQQITNHDLLGVVMKGEWEAKCMRYRNTDRLASLSPTVAAIMNEIALQGGSYKINSIPNFRD